MNTFEYDGYEYQTSDLVSFCSIYPIDTVSAQLLMPCIKNTKYPSVIDNNILQFAELINQILSTDEKYCIILKAPRPDQFRLLYGFNYITKCLKSSFNRLSVKYMNESDMSKFFWYCKKKIQNTNLL